MLIKKCSVASARLGYLSIGAFALLVLFFSNPVLAKSHGPKKKISLISVASKDSSDFDASNRPKPLPQLIVSGTAKDISHTSAYLTFHLTGTISYQSYIQKSMDTGLVVVNFKINKKHTLTNIAFINPLNAERDMQVLKGLQSFPVNWPLPKSGKYQLSVKFTKTQDNVVPVFTLKEITG